MLSMEEMLEYLRESNELDLTEVGTMAGFKDINSALRTHIYPILGKDVVTRTKERTTITRDGACMLFAKGSGDASEVINTYIHDILLPSIYETGGHIQDPELFITKLHPGINGAVTARFMELLDTKVYLGYDSLTRTGVPLDEVYAHCGISTTEGNILLLNEGYLRYAPRQRLILTDKSIRLGRDDLMSTGLPRLSNYGVNVIIAFIKEVQESFAKMDLPFKVSLSSSIVSLNEVTHPEEDSHVF